MRFTVAKGEEKAFFAKRNPPPRTKEANLRNELSSGPSDLPTFESPWHELTPRSGARSLEHPIPHGLRISFALRDWRRTKSRLIAARRVQQSHLRAQRVQAADRATLRESRAGCHAFVMSKSAFLPKPEGRQILAYGVSVE